MMLMPCPGPQFLPQTPEQEQQQMAMLRQLVQAHPLTIPLDKSAATGKVAQAINFLPRTTVATPPSDNPTPATLTSK